MRQHKGDNIHSSRFQFPCCRSLTFAKARPFSKPEGHVPAGIEMDFHEFVTDPHSTSTLLDGALRIRCTNEEVLMKARLCPLNEFGQIAEHLQRDKLVSTCNIM